MSCPKQRGCDFTLFQMTFQSFQSSVRRDHCLSILPIPWRYREALVWPRQGGMLQHVTLLLIPTFQEAVKYPCPVF